jgi:hypothetical protein
MKTIDSRKVVVVATMMLAVTLAAGCFDGGSGYSNYPSGYNGGRAYPQSYQNSNSYNAGYQNGVRADESRDRHQERDTDEHVVVTHDRDQRHTEKQSPDVDHDGYARKESQSGHASVGY